MAEERERTQADRRLIDEADVGEEEATGPDVEAHQASGDRHYGGRDDDRDAEADEGRERRK